MSEQNLSQWFLLSEQKPWEVGVYEVRSRIGIAKVVAYWNGKRFGYAQPFDEYKKGSFQKNVNSVYGDERIDIDFEITHWRGINTNPEKPKKSVKPRNTRKQFIIVMEASGDKLQIQHPIGAFEDEKNADAFLAIHQKRCPKFYYYKTWTPRFRTPE